MTTSTDDNDQIMWIWPWQNKSTIIDKLFPDGISYANSVNCTAFAPTGPTGPVGPTQESCQASGWGYAQTVCPGPVDWTAAQCATKYIGDTTLFNNTTCASVIAQLPPSVCPTCATPVYDATTCAAAIQTALTNQPAPVIADWTMQQCSDKYFKNTGWQCVGLNGTSTDTPVRRLDGGIQCLGTDGIGCSWVTPAQCAVLASTPPSTSKPSQMYGVLRSGWPSVAHTRLV